MAVGHSSTIAPQNQHDLSIRITGSHNEGSMKSTPAGPIMRDVACIGQTVERETVRRARSATMKVNLEPRQGGVVVARLTGRLDFSSAQAARGEFSDAITAGYPKLVIDLGKIEFVDSAGLGSLIGGMRRARQAGGDLRIANPNDQVKTLLSLTSLDQVLKVHPTIEEAVVGFSR